MMLRLYGAFKAACQPGAAHVPGLRPRMRRLWPSAIACILPLRNTAVRRSAARDRPAALRRDFRADAEMVSPLPAGRR